MIKLPQPYRRWVKEIYHYESPLKQKHIESMMDEAFDIMGMLGLKLAPKGLHLYIKILHRYKNKLGMNCIMSIQGLIDQNISLQLERRYKHWKLLEEKNQKR